MHSNLQGLLCLIFALYTVCLLINLGNAEVCFQDANCTSGEFCNLTRTRNISIHGSTSGKHRTKHDTGNCAKCIDCAELNRQENRNKNRICATHVRDCGECLSRYEPIITHAGYHVNCTSMYPMNSTDLNSTMSELNETEGEVAEGDDTAGMIAGGVCIGIAAIVILAFLTFFGVRYCNRKRKHTKDPEMETETTVELQELKPVPVKKQNQNETLRDPVQIEEKQKI